MAEDIRLINALDHDDNNNN